MKWDVRKGMFVRTADGQKLGTVIRLGEDTFVVEKGLFLPRDFVLRFEDVVGQGNGEVRLRQTLEDLVPGRVEREGHPQRREVVVTEALGEPQEVVMELAHEEAVPQLTVREVGRVLLRKVVRTEVKHLEVTVRREELIVERLDAQRPEAAPRQARPHVPSQGEPALATGAAPFEEESFVIPLREEQVEVSKVARVWQEVRVSRLPRVERREVRTPLLREVADVEEEGEVEHEGPLDGLHS